MKNEDKWMRGLPYVGNKSQKAKQIIDLLPRGNRFVDVFGGGGCISLTAYNSNKWDNIYYNDIRKSVVDLLSHLLFNKDVNLNKYTYITRSQFEHWRDNEPDSGERTLVLLCWSFGNRMKTFVWGQQIEDLKLLLTRGLIYGDTGTTKDLLFKDSNNYGSILDIYKYFHKMIKNSDVLLPSTVKSPIRLEQMERLQQLERVKNSNISPINFITSSKDYKNLEILPDDIVYCDPPYINTKEDYQSEFNNKEFDNWLNKLPTDNIYISEYAILDNTKVFYNLGTKASFRANGTRRDELLLKYIHH